MHAHMCKGERLMGIRICPDCGGKVSNSRKDCIHCGYVFPVTKQCPDCGESVEENAKECPICGHIFIQTQHSVGIDGFEFEIVGDHAVLKKVDANKVAGNVVIPSKYQGKSVTIIGKQAFYDCSNLTSITIPASVKSIRESAFERCSNLTDVYYTGDIVGWCGITFRNCADANPMFYADNLYIGGNLVEGELIIPARVKSIRDWAFKNCTGLTSVVIPDRVKSIGWAAFQGCRSLTSITIPNSVTTIGDWAFDGCNRLTSVVIPGSVKSIGEYAFARCTSLTSVNIPDSVTTIGTGNFSDCTSLTSVNIPDRVTTIDSYAFKNCTSLTSIIIPDSVTTIGKEAFAGCSRLTSIVVDEANATYKSIDGNLYSKDGKSLIQYAVGNTTFEIPDSVTTIGSSAFYGCNSLTSITIPDSVTTIAYGAFKNCTGLTSVVIPDSVTTIGNYAFYDCDSLTSVTFGENSKLTSIGLEAFYGCTSLTSITIPDSVKSISGDAFRGCSSLESLTIPFVGTKAGIKSTSKYQYPFGYIFGTDSYEGGVSTKQYFYDDSTSSTTYDTYYIPSSLKSVTVTGGHIPYGAFYNCRNITNITLGDSVTTIGSSAFHGCSSLTSVTFEDPNGWYMTADYDDGLDKTGSTKMSVTNASTNATYLQSTYCYCCWRKKKLKSRQLK